MAAMLPEMLMLMGDQVQIKPLRTVVFEHMPHTLPVIPGARGRRGD